MDNFAHFIGLSLHIHVSENSGSIIAVKKNLQFICSLFIQM